MEEVKKEPSAESLSGWSILKAEEATTDETEAKATEAKTKSTAPEAKATEAKTKSTAPEAEAEAKSTAPEIPKSADPEAMLKAAIVKATQNTAIRWVRIVFTTSTDNYSFLVVTHAPLGETLKSFAARNFTLIKATYTECIKTAYEDRYDHADFPGEVTFSPEELKFHVSHKGENECRMADEFLLLEDQKFRVELDISPRDERYKTYCLGKEEEEEDD